MFNYVRLKLHCLGTVPYNIFLHQLIQRTPPFLPATPKKKRKTLTADQVGMIIQTINKDKPISKQFR